jgi:S1-C subfamily serine protease
MGRVGGFLLFVLLLVGSCTRSAPTQPGPGTPAPTRQAVAIRGFNQSVWRCFLSRAESAVVHVRTDVAGSGLAGPTEAATRPLALQSGGTGVVVHPGGCVLTAAHVLKDAVDVQVVFQDGSSCRPARVVVDARYDLAVLIIAADEVLAVVPAPAMPARGARVAAVGCPKPGQAALVRPGVITGPARDLDGSLDPADLRDYGALIESTAVLEPGFSGGPLVDDQGRMIGVNVATAGAGEAQRGYAIPFSGAVRAAVARLCCRVLAEGSDRP